MITIIQARVNGVSAALTMRSLHLSRRNRYHYGNNVYKLYNEQKSRLPASLSSRWVRCLAHKVSLSTLLAVIVTAAPKSALHPASV